MIYHEKQSKELCALHVLNNIFQSHDAFTQKDLDKICNELSPNTWINPHKSWLGLGNYDINVLTAALQTRDYSVVWFDKRKDPSCISLGKVLGFILNIPSEYKVGWIHLPTFNRKHWIAMRKIEETFYNLDSKLSSPSLIGDELEFINFLREQLKVEDIQLLLVVEKSVAEFETWKLKICS